jgi:Tfp pilus assembly protein PilX
MRQIRRHRGFVLIMVVVLLPLFGAAVLVTTAQTAQLSRSLRAAEQDAAKKTLLLSAEAWLRANRADMHTLEAGMTISVPVADAASCPAGCKAEVTARDSSGVALMLKMTIGEGDKTISFERPFYLVATK